MKTTYPSFAAQASTRIPTQTTSLAHNNAIIERYLERADAFSAIEENDRAIFELREAIESYPKNADCHRALADIYFRTGSKTLARVHARQVLTLVPGDSRASQIMVAVSRTSSQPAKCVRNNKSTTKMGDFISFLAQKCSSFAA